MSADSEVVLSPEAATDLARSILVAAGTPEDKAQLVAASLVASNLRGIDSHGLQLLPFYLRHIECGNINPRAEGHIVREDGATLLYDGEQGLGAVISAVCCDHASRLAAAHGAGLVVARNSTHFGMAATWALRMSAAGNIGIVMCNASPIVPPWQGKEPRLGTNPICMSVPGDPAKTWLLDMATTTVAAGKIFKAYINKQPSIPPGWALDSEGRPTTETKAAYHGLIMPLGGYKGSGLAVMVEILCGVLSGGATSMEVGGIRLTDRPFGTSQMFLAIDVGRFLPREEFEARMDSLVEVVKSAAVAAGYAEILVAGDPERRMEARRHIEGIPIAPGTWQDLCAAQNRLPKNPGR